MCLGVAGGGHGAPRVPGHLDIGRQVTGDDCVQRNQYEQRQPEEEDDNREEVALGPRRVHVGVAHRGLGVIMVLSDCEHGRGQEDREEPRDEAHQPRLVLGPDEARSQGQTDCIIPEMETQSDLLSLFFAKFLTGGGDLEGV